MDGNNKISCYSLLPDSTEFIINTFMQNGIPLTYQLNKLNLFYFLFLF